MANTTINALTSASTIDPVNDLLPIYQNSTVSTLAINRNTYLGLSSAPVGLTDSQTLTNKTLTSPTINGATLSGTLSGTYTIGGTPTFPATVVQTTASQTLTNKTLTSPSITSPTITNATISADAITGYTTANAGTIYGLSISGGTLNGSSITASSITNTQIANAGLYTSKFYNPYKFSVYLNTALTLGTAGTYSAITFSTKNFDTNNNFSTSTYKYTAPVSGYYYFYGAVCFNVGVTPAYVACYLYQNASFIDYATGTSSSVQGNPQIKVNQYVYANAGDTFSMQAAAGNNGVGIYTANYNTYFGGFLVSAT